MANQVIGQESALNPKVSSTHVTIVVRKVTRRRNVNRLKGVAKEKASTKSATKANGCGNKPHHVIVEIPVRKQQSAVRVLIS